MFYLIISAWRLLSCVVFSVRVRFCLAVSVFICYCFSFFYRVCGSGARGLIKAPAGDRGLAPGRLARSCAWAHVYFESPLVPGGIVGGCPHRSLLDLPVWTDTGGGSVGVLGVLPLVLGYGL